MSAAASHDVVRRLAPRSAWRFREIVLVLFWSGISNLFLISVFFWYAGVKLFPDIGLGIKPNDFVALPSDHDPLAGARLMRSDFGLSLYPSLETKGRKQSLPLSVVPPSLSGSSWSAVFSADRQVPKSDYVAEPDLQDGEDMTSMTPVTTEEARGLHVAPILRKNESTGKLEIGSFKPVTFVGRTDECLIFGQSILGDVKVSPGLLNVLAQSDQITITKICASNGSVIMTCRNDQITISPRRPRPDDRCVAPG